MEHWESYFPARDAPVDVEAYDRPCDAAPLQWWYVHAHLTMLDNGDEGNDDSCGEESGGDKAGDEPSRVFSFADPLREMGFFASFFRQNGGSARGEEGRARVYDACTWAVIDFAKSEYHAAGLVDEGCFDVIQARLDDAESEDLSELQRDIMHNVLRARRIPRPERCMRRPATVTTSPTTISLDGGCTIRMSDEVCEETGRRRRVYELTHSDAERGTGAHLWFYTTAFEPVRQGQNGVVNGMFYYYFPAMDVHGSVTLNGETKRVRGRGWYDREFGGSPTRKGREAPDAWSWYALLLSTGASLNVFLITDVDTGEQRSSAVYVGPSGERVFCDEVRYEVHTTWTSLRTFIEYVAMVTLSVPAIGFECTVTPRFAHQEFTTILAPGGGFYEGAVAGHGRFVVSAESNDNTPADVRVRGFFEQKVAATPRGTEEILAGVSKHVQHILATYYPLQADEQWFRENVFGTAYGRVCQHIAPQLLCDSLFRPVRHLIDHGGKAWRSLILVSCCNALSYNYFDCTRYIAMAELLHVGSLIIDDIEDGSVVRRGAPTAHLVSGVPTAINAGTLCYFMAPYLARIDDLPPLKSLRVHQLYLSVLRLAHVGQGVDIAGLDMYMPDAVRSGDTVALENALYSVHACKTGLVSGAACRIACIICDAADALTEAMDTFGINVGIAFQIIDDALNIKGFKNGLKQRAEDIRDGKITAPVVLALSQLEYDDRCTLWNTLKSKPQDDGDVGVVVNLICKTNAIEVCRQRACAYIEDGWNLIDPLLEESYSKNILHTFCSFLLNRDF